MFYQVLLDGRPQSFNDDAWWPTAHDAICAAEEICATGNYRQRECLIRTCAVYACETQLGMARFTGRDETGELCSVEAKERLRDHSAASIAADVDRIVGPFLAYHASDYLDEVVKEIEAELPAERGMSQRELVD